MQILVTGGAGFIGSHTARALLDQGHDVVVVDNFTDYYDPALKEYRMKTIPEATLYRVDIADENALKTVFAQHSFDRVLHLAAQAGVRYSLINPLLYIDRNLRGTTSVFECCRTFGVKNVVYASSSSVYGGNTKIPFSETDPVNDPLSLYAATKRSCELIAHTYHGLHGLNCTGLRFFTVYGPMGRPDMVAWIFAKNILEGKPIELFNNGNMKRDFTFVSDIVAGIIKCVERPFEDDVINLGNNKPVEMLYFTELLEGLLGRKAERKFAPMQLGDVPATWADISKAKKLLDWEPHTTVEEGLRRFVEWFVQYNSVKK